MRFSLLISCTLAVVVSIASPAEAQRSPRRTPDVAVSAPAAQAEPTSRDQEARMLFEAGRVAYAAGRFEDSLDYFQRAHAMSGRDVLLYNVASAADKLRRDAVALDAFRRYLAAVPTAANRAEVESRVVVLEGVVAAEQARLTPTLPVATEPTETTEVASTETQSEAAVDVSLQVGAADDRDVRDDRGGIFGKWWFWTIVGAVVVGGTVAAIAAASSGGGLGALANGDDGHIYMTLSMPR